MSTATIDDRIARFSIDDCNLVRKAPSVVNIMDKLKASMDFSKSTKSLENIDKAAKNIDWNHMSRSVDFVAGRFSALGIMGVTALQRIANEAITTGMNLVNSLTVAPVTAGFSEYETKMGSIQTILTNTASKGTTIQDVNAVLQELNEYADQTIYNFAEMTRNIGTFTAAGIDLDRSAVAIKGIANLAAGSGSTSQQASTAMYQLSQALAAGTVKLMDWNSVVNAGMGGELFQNALKETAREQGIAVDKMIKKNGSFRESLQEGWITSEVLIKTLEKFANDESLVKAATEVKTITQLMDTMKESVQSGWAVSWEYIIGDKEQATKTLTAISDAFNNMIGPSTEARNEALRLWNAFGGRAYMLEGLSNLFKGLGSAVEAVIKPFKKIFPTIEGGDLIKWSAQFRDFSKVFVMSDATGEHLTKTFEGLFSAVSIVGKIIKGIMSPVGALLKLCGSLTLGLLKVTGAIGGWITELDAADDKTGFIVNGIADKFKWFTDAVNRYQTNGLAGVFPDATTFVTSTLDAINNLVIGLKTVKAEISASINETVTGIQNGFTNTTSKVFNALVTAITWVADGVKAVGSGIKAVVNGVRQFITGVRDSFFRLVEAFGDAWSMEAIRDATFTGILAGVGLGIKKAITASADVITNFGDVLKSFKGIFANIAQAVGGVTKALDGIRDSIDSFNKSIKAKTLLTVAGAIAILAASLMLLSYVNPETFTDSFIAILSFVGSLMIALDQMQKLKIDGIGAAAVSMVIVAAAIGVMATALSKVAAYVTNDNLVAVLAALFGLVVSLTGGMGILSKWVANPKEMISTAVGLIIMASAFKKMAGAFEAFGSIEQSALKQGLWGMGVMLAEVALFIRTAKLDQLKNGKKVLLEISVALLMLVGSVAILGNLDTMKLVQGLGAVAALLLALGVAIRVMNSANLSGVAVTLLALAMAMDMLLIPIAAMAFMPTEKLCQGLLALAGVMVVFAGVMVGLGAAGKYIANFAGVSLALIAMAAAINMLIVPITILGALPLAVVLAGLLGVALAMTGLAIAATLLSPMTVPLLAVAAAMGVFGLAVLGLGTGLSALATGFLKLATLTSVGAAAVVASLTAITTGLVVLIPVILAKLGEGIVEMIVAIASSIVDNACILLDKLTVLLGAILDWINYNAPPIIATVANVVVELVLAIMRVIKEKTPELINTFFEMVIEVINGLAHAIRTYPKPIFDALGNLLSAILEFILTCIAELLRLIPGVGNDIADCVLDIRDDMREYLAPQSMTEISEDAAQGLAQGFTNETDTVAAAASELADAATGELSGLSSDMETAGSYGGEGFVKGLKGWIGAAKTAGAQIGKAAHRGANEELHVKSPSRKFMETGEFGGEGFVIGLLHFVDAAKKAGAKIGNDTLTALNDAFGRIGDMLNADLDMSPRIVPVIDMANVQNGVARINRAFNMKRPLAVSALTSAQEISTVSSRGSASTFGSNSTAHNNGDTYIYNQTINSPKHLSRYEIYRQTKSLISRQKGRTTK